MDIPIETDDIPRTAPEPAAPPQAHLEPSRRATADPPPSGRRVQWVNLSEPEEDEGRHVFGQARRSSHQPAAHDGHISLSIPPPDHSHSNGGDYFGNVDTAASTPEGMSTATTPEASRPGTPTFGGNIDILDGERDGLPLPTHRNPAHDFKRQAAKLVAVHKAKERFMSGRKAHTEEGGVDAGAVAAALRTAVPRVSPDHPTDDIPPPQPHTHHGHGRSTPAPGGRGVLSSLLRLYDQPNAPSANSSQATLVHYPTQESSRRGSTPPSSRGSFDVLSNALKTGRRVLDPVVIKPVDEVANLAGKGVKGVKGAVDDFATARGHVERPAAARSGGGVFAALQAGALDLAGAAAPNAANIRPVTDKSGFRVERYRLDPMPPPINGTTASPAATPNLHHKDHEPNLKQRRGHKVSHVSLGELGHVFDAKNYYNESSVLKSRSQPGTPSGEWSEKVYEKPRARKKQHRKRQDEIFITMHVAAILQRQDFILRLGRALMMFGAPSHRLETQLQSTASVLEIKVQVIFLMNFMIIAFQDDDTHTSDIKFIKQGSALDIAKLTELSTLHWEVMHDKIGVEDASVEISRLMKRRTFLRTWQLCIVGAFCSAFISIDSFFGSLIDLLVSMVLGAGLVAVQLWVNRHSDILSSIFEIVIAGIISLIAAALASTDYFCYDAVVSSSIVLLLPGWIVCCAALELGSRSIVCGSVRFVWAIFYSLLLGFGISIGARVWVLFSDQQVVAASNNTCPVSHWDPDTGLSYAWWRRTIPLYFAVLSVPGYSAALALRNGADPRRKEFPVLVAISCCGWVVNHYSAFGFPGRSDISSMLGAFTVGLLGNVWGKFFQGTSFIVAVVGILFQLPSGLGNGGLLNYAATTTDSTSDAFSSGFSVAEQLITVSIGLVVGLFCSTAIVYPFGKRRGGLNTF